MKLEKCLNFLRSVWSFLTYYPRELKRLLSNIQNNNNEIVRRGEELTKVLKQYKNIEDFLESKEFGEAYLKNGATSLRAQVKSDQKRAIKIIVGLVVFTAYSLLSLVFLFVDPIIIWLIPLIFVWIAIVFYAGWQLDNSS